MKMKTSKTKRQTPNECARNAGHFWGLELWPLGFFAEVTP